MKLLCIKRIASAAGLALLILLCLPAAVAAHPMKGVGDFYSGMLHPLTALEFLLSWVALAMFAGQQGRKTALLTLAIFPIRACIRRKLRHSRAIARLAARDESGSHPNPGSRGSARDFLSNSGNGDLGSPRRTPAWSGNNRSLGFGLWNWLGALRQKTMDSDRSSRGGKLDHGGRHHGLRSQTLKRGFQPEARGNWAEGSQ